MRGLGRSGLAVLANHRFVGIAAVYTTADIVADGLLGPSQSVTALLVIVPLLVAFEWDWRKTGATTLLPIVLTGTNLFGYDHLPAAVVASRLVAVVVGCTLAVYASVEFSRRQTASAQSRAAAGAAQRAILPIVPERSGPYQFSSLYRSSAEESVVGGDFYKVIASPWGARFIVGDVEGKGLAAVGMSALVLGCFREWAPRTPTLPDLVAILDERVHSYEERSAFVTAVIGTLDDGLTLELANCGHVHPVLSRGGAWVVVEPEHTTTPLGLSPKPAIERLELRPHDRLLFYTDGLTETRTRAGAWVPLDDVIPAIGSDPLESALDNVATRLTTLGTLRDDLAMLLVEVGPSTCGCDAGSLTGQPAGLDRRA